MNTPFDQTPVMASTSSGKTGLIRATGPTRKAGYVICLSGICLTVSAFLPWSSVGTVHLSGGGVVMLLVIGGLLALLGGRILQDRLSMVVNELATIDIFLAVSLFRAGDQLNNVQPAIGFYLGLAGLMGSVVGNVLVQTIRRKRARNHGVH